MQYYAFSCTVLTDIKLYLLSDVKPTTLSYGQEISLKIKLPQAETYIAQGFAVLQHLRFVCSGGSVDGKSKYDLHTVLFTIVQCLFL